MVSYIIGGLIGGFFGYTVLYKLLGCQGGGCPIAASPYASAVYGILLGVLIAGLIAVPGAKSQPPLAEYKKITAEDAKLRIDSGDIIILDVRTEAEYSSGHIPGAVLLSNEVLSDKALELLPNLNAEILIYCRSGNRSAQAANKLIALGYTNVYDFGGIIDWPYEIVN